MSVEVIVGSGTTPTGFGVWLLDGYRICASSPCCGDMLKENKHTAACLACRKRYPKLLPDMNGGTYYTCKLFDMKPGDNWTMWLEAITGYPRQWFDVKISD